MTGLDVTRMSINHCLTFFVQAGDMVLVLTADVEGSWTVHKYALVSFKAAIAIAIKSRELLQSSTSDWHIYTKNHAHQYLLRRLFDRIFEL